MIDEMKDSLSVNKEEERIARVSGNIEYLCEELATNKNLDCNDWFEQFSDFSETIDRLAYSDISRYIFGLEPKGLGILKKKQRLSHPCSVLWQYSQKDEMIISTFLYMD